MINVPITVTLAVLRSFDSNVCTQQEYSPVWFHIGFVTAIARYLCKCSADTGYVVFTRFLKPFNPNGWRAGIHWYTGWLLRNHFNTNPFSCGSISYSQSNTRCSGLCALRMYCDGTLNLVIFTVRTVWKREKKEENKRYKKVIESVQWIQKM